MQANPGVKQPVRSFPWKRMMDGRAITCSGSGRLLARGRREVGIVPIDPDVKQGALWVRDPPWWEGVVGAAVSAYSMANNLCPVLPGTTGWRLQYQSRIKNNL